MREILTLLLLIIFVKSDSNLSNFQKDSFAFLINVLFVGLLRVVAYILFLFWIDNEYELYVINETLS